MAVIPFSIADIQADGYILLAGPLGVGDSTDDMTINEGDTDLTVHLYGTSGGATTAVLGSLLGIQFSVMDDSYGDPMSYSSVTGGVIKPVGPAVEKVRVVNTGGGGSTEVYVEVYKTRKAR